MKITLTLLTILLLAPLAAVHAADAPKPSPADLPASIRPNPEWTAQAAKDAKQDFTSIPFDGIAPNKLACDTTLRELPDGSWVMIMLGGGDTEPRRENHVLLTRSHDRGKTWSPMQPLDFGFPREGDTIAMVPSELMVHPGRCTLFFATHDGTFAGWKEWMTHSADGCRTWSKPEPAPGRLHDRTFIRNHIVTRDGRVLIPFQHYRRVKDAKTIDNNRRLSEPTDPRNGVLMSADGGKTWTEHGDLRISKDETYYGWAENNIVELSGGRIAMIIRADGLGGVLYYAESKDGGRTWPEFAVKSDIPNPGTKATLHPLGGDTVALLHNPNPKGRHPLALWISFDGMKTWPYQRVLVEHSSDGPGRSLNYPDGFVSKDKQWLHFAYDDNRHRAVHYSARLPPLESHADDAVPGGMLERRGLPRVLFNNDSDDLKFAAYPETHGALWVPAGELVPRREITSVDDYLSYRIGPLAKTAVSGLSYCGNFGSPVWDLRRDHVAALGEDPLQPILGFWRRDGRRFFFSMRMNDKHHAWFNWPHLWDEFRRTHRHWFLAPPTEAEWTDDFLPWLNDPTKPSSTEFIAKVTTRPQKLRRDSDALLYDYSKPEVRSHYLDVLREACRRYDIDGVELDWLRYPRFFREGEVDAAVITAFVRDARSILDEAATRRGHPLRLVTRVPDSPGSARRIGLDVEAWLEAGWIDAVIAGHGFTFNSNELDQWVAVAHRHHVPVYGVLERMPRGFARYGTPETLRAAAAALWARGADGLYLFNFYNTAEYPLLADLADPARLALRPKEFFLDACWTTDNGTVSKPPLPLIVQAGSPARATLFLTDDPAHATELELEIAWKGAGDFAAPDVVVNGQKLGGQQLGSQKLDGLRLDRGKAAFAAVSAVRLENGETPLTVSCSSASLANVFRRGANECVFTSTSDATLTALDLKLTPAPSTDSRAPQ